MILVLLLLLLLLSKYNFQPDTHILRFHFERNVIFLYIASNKMLYHIYLVYKRNEKWNEKYFALQCIFA